MNEKHESNRAYWNANAPRWKEDAVKMNWDQCHKDPTIRFASEELQAMGDMSGKTACVFASGDNRAVFSLVGMGATVTSVDISENQLQVAKERAEQIGLDVRFIRADVTSVRELNDGEFDLVFMGGGAIIWFEDLRAVYQEAARILKPGGKLAVRDRHPFANILGDHTVPEIRYPYLEPGPRITDTEYGVKEYLFHWTVSEQFRAMTEAGCEVIRIDEFGKAEWDDSPASRLPGALYMVGRKGTSSDR